MDLRTWLAIETAIRRDPAGRGVASFQSAGQWLASGHLHAAAEHIARHAAHVGIVTGFPIPVPRAVAPEAWACETDGPLGALQLAAALRAAGIRVTLLASELAAPVLEAGCVELALPTDVLRVAPWDATESNDPRRASLDQDACAVVDAWIERLFCEDVGRSFTHLIAIELPGPGDAGTCLNMRGEPITAWTGKLHRLFESMSGRSAFHTIGIGDGGNEVGLGCVPRAQLEQAIRPDLTSAALCRVATDWTILCGVSNWGAYALGDAVAALRNPARLGEPWDESGHRRLLERLVAAGAVDGVTRRAESTVDGIPWEEYVAVPAAIRSAILAR